MYWLTLLLAAALLPGDSPAFRQPQLASYGGLTALTFGSENAIYFESSRDSGKTWTNPAKVDEPGVLSLGNHRGPRVGVTKGAIVISAVAGKTGKGADGDLLTWRSTDNGKTWQAGATITDVPGAAREGLHTMTAAPDGRLFAAWLDLRNLKPGMPGTELWGAYSSDAGRTWSKNFAVYKSPSGSICTCCHPTAMFTKSGKLEVMWRNELDGDRDMYLMESADGGQTFGAAKKLGTGNWKLNACPMDGGGVAEARDGSLVTVWRREKSVYVAPGGGAETLVKEGKNPAIASGKAGVYTAWNTAEGLFASVPGSKEPVLLDPAGAFVTLTAVPNGAVLAAWERKGTIQFHTLP